MTIAVNLGGPLENIQISKDKQEPPTKESETFHEKINYYIDSLKQNLQREVEEIDLGVYDIANQAFDAMQSTIARQKLAAYPPDHEITIARNACGTLEFDRADEMIALGYRKAKECFSNL